MASAILVADCGSTSCEWRLIEHDKMLELPTTRGFNPTYEPAENLIAELKMYREFEEISGRVGSVHYYGAGCASEISKEKVRTALANSFKLAEVEIMSDLWGAARAVYSGKPLICGILGTGSNACLFDGHEIRLTTPSLGFILGDEGSGNHIGRLLLRAYFYQTMPEQLRTAFSKRYTVDLDDVLKSTYRGENVSGYLAQFAEFAGEYRDEDFIRELVRGSMRNFLVHYVCSVADYKNLSVSLVGSVAYFFRDIIEEVAQEHGIALDLVLRRPIDKLAEYHLRGN